MKKLLIALLLAALLVPAAQAITTDANFDYNSIVGFAQGHYGEVYTIVGRVLQIEEYHRSSADDIVEEYTKIAVDDDPEQIICLHYTRPKNQMPMETDIYVATLAYVDGVQRIGQVIVPLLESKSEPIIIDKGDKQ